MGLSSKSSDTHSYRTTLKHRQRQKRYYQANREAETTKQERYRLRLKTETLTYYGKGGKLQCCWPGCNEVDLDVLTLDHVNDDGGRGRRSREHGSGTKFYRWLRDQNYPDGFQTLCGSHQLKKEILKQRRAAQGFRLLMAHLKAIPECL